MAFDRDTSMYRLRAARPGDLPALRQLLAAAGLPRVGVADRLEAFLVAEADGRVVGCAGLEAYGEVGLLRSLCVHPAHRGRGVGERLVRAALARGRETGVREVVLLTTTAAPYFHRLGFRQVDRDRLDPRIQASPEFREVCCASAAAMHLRLDEERDGRMRATRHEERVGRAPGREVGR